MRETMRMKTHPQHFISKPRRSSRVGMTIGIDLGDIWSHYCTLNEDGEVVDRGRFRANPSGVDKRFRDIGPRSEERRPGPVPNQPVGGGQALPGYWTGASGHGSRNPLDLGQRTDSGAWP